MPPKKPEVLTEEQIAEETGRWTLREKALRNLYIRKQLEVVNARREEEELRENLRLLEEAFGEARSERFDIVSDFTRQLKATEDILVSECTELDTQITDLKDQQDVQNLTLEQTVLARDQYIQHKEQEYQEQETRMKQMEEEFRLMLAETHNHVSDRISGNFGGANGGHQGGDDDDEEDEDDDDGAAAPDGDADAN